jgi:DNA-binding XRE family transcriptional regulator
MAGYDAIPTCYPEKGARMTRLEVLRVQAGLSKAKLARLADLNTATITWAEQRGFRLYDVQLERIARVLEWTDDPAALLEAVQ